MDDDPRERPTGDSTKQAASDAGGARESKGRGAHDAAPGGGVPVALQMIAAVGAVCSVLVYIRFAGNGFWGDDFELLADGLTSPSLLKPISVHLRPLVRLHFLLYHLGHAPALFHVLQLGLHFAVGAAIYPLVRDLYEASTARFTSLLFIGLFPPDEAVYWVSAVGVVYCLLFATIALREWLRKRPLRASLALVLAAVSYELWLVVIPVWLWKRGRAKDWIVPGLLFGAFAILYVVNFGAGGATAYGAVGIADLPSHLAVYAFDLFSPTVGSPGLLVSLAIVIAFVILAVRAPSFRFPVLFYMSSALVLSLSPYVPSRFAYFPQLALALMIALCARFGRIYAWAVAAVTAYLVLGSAVLLWQDGRDYQRLAAFYTGVVDSVRTTLADVNAGEDVVLVNRQDDQEIRDLAASFTGRRKPPFLRSEGVKGAIDLPVVATLVLHDRGLRAVADECRGSARDLGSGPIVATYCFRVEEE